MERLSSILLTHTRVSVSYKYTDSKNMGRDVSTGVSPSRDHGGLKRPKMLVTDVGEAGCWPNTVAEAR